MSFYANATIYSDIFILYPTLMDTFFNLNRAKIRFAFVATSLTLIGFVLLVLTIAYFAKNLPDKELLTAIFLAAGVGLPIFIITLLYIKWLYRKAVRQKAFSLEPFNQLENIGFVNSFSNIETKWHFTEKVKIMLLDGYTLIIDISEESNKNLELKIPIEWKKLDKTSFNELTDKFNRHNIEVGIGCLKKKYKTNGSQFLKIDELKLDLEKFIELIKEEGFEPKKQERLAHNIACCK
jgi:uncharacterized membrane protein (DUF485 family)